MSYVCFAVDPTIHRIFIVLIHNAIRSLFKRFWSAFTPPVINYLSIFVKSSPWWKNNISLVLFLDFRKKKTRLSKCGCLGNIKFRWQWHVIPDYFEVNFRQSSKVCKFHPPPPPPGQDRVDKIFCIQWKYSFSCKIMVFNWNKDFIITTFWSMPLVCTCIADFITSQGACLANPSLARCRGGILSFSNPPELKGKPAFKI